MTASARYGWLGGLLAVALGAAALAPPIPQDPAYHRMVDARPLAGMPNAANVLSNLPFVLVGAAGLLGLGPGRRGAWGIHFVDRRERWPYAVFFAGILLTGLGSAHYHWAPDNARLVWDRLPLAASMMGLFAGTIGDRLGARAGLAALGPLVALGLASVLVWHAGEARGAGDLRLYALVQFFPLVAIPAMALLFPPRYTRGADLVIAAAIYGLAKLGEMLDAGIYALGGAVSGHTVKHLLAAAACGWIGWMLVRREPATATGES